MRDLIITYVRLSTLIVKLMIDKMSCRNEANANSISRRWRGEGQARKAKNGIVYAREILNELQ